MFNKLREQKEQNRLRYFTYSVYGVMLGLFFLMLLGLFGLFLGSQGSLNNMFIFNSRPTWIITGSMEPAIKVNGVVMLEPVEFEDIKEGDIIRYTSYQGYSVLHRVIHKMSSYVVTKGDANAVQDNFVVTPDRITGRVSSIHNEVEPFITLLFGKFSYDDPMGSFARYGLGFLGIALFIFIMIVLFIVIFEMITTVYFFRKYNSHLIKNSQYWVEKVKSKDEQIEIFENYFEGYKKANPFKKVILAFKLRRYYNGLCNIESEVLKTEKRLNSLNKTLK